MRVNPWLVGPPKSCAELNIKKLKCYETRLDTSSEYAHLDGSQAESELKFSYQVQMQYDKDPTQVQLIYSPIKTCLAYEE